MNGFSFCRLIPQKTSHAGEIGAASIFGSNAPTLPEDGLRMFGFSCSVADGLIAATWWRLLGRPRLSRSSRSMPLKILHLPLMFLRRLERLESAEIPPLVRLRIFLSRI